MESLAGSLIPSALTPLQTLILVAASFGTSFITVSFGIGGGATMIALMSYLVPAAALIPVHGAVQLGSNGGRAIVLRKHVDWRRIAAFSGGAVIGAAIGAAIAVRLQSDLILIGLGVFIVASTWIPLKRMAALQAAGFALIGLFTTFIGMFFGATGPMNAALLSNSFSERRIVVGSLAALMTAQHGFKVLGFALVGFAFWPWLPLVLIMIASGFAGTVAGSRLLYAIPEQSFRLVLKSILTLLAAGMVYRGLAEL
ncbi:MAG: sulfite exporter TauE/SafE family protein [Pseudomonadota bacterium]